MSPAELPPAKPLHPVGSSLRDLTAFPVAIREAFGARLRFAQLGGYPEGSRPFYRAAFVVQFKECVYLLHVFKKKSSSGRETPRPDKATILARWKAALEDHHERYGK